MLGHTENIKGNSHDAMHGDHLVASLTGSESETPAKEEDDAAMHGGRSDTRANKLKGLTVTVMTS